MSLFETIAEMGPTRKAGLALGAALILGLALYALYYFGSDKYAVLFADVNEQDAAGVLSELEKMKVDYRLEQGGSSILVPSGQVHETRLKLMGAGAPLSGGVGFEVFDNSEFGMTEFAQKINFQRALQGELTRTIMSLRAVKYARVHLVMPEQSLFRQDEKPASASVTLFLETGHALDAMQVLGIQRLVAAAVPGLEAAQVTVSDQDGATLSRVVADAESRQVGGRLQQKQAVEAYLAGKANEVLRRAFGPDQAMVSVDVAINFDQVTTTRENVTSGDDQSATILRRRESKFVGDAKKNQSGNTTTEIEYLHGRTIAEIVETPGRIERIAVGVLVPPDTPASRYDEIGELVAVSVGLDPARGDAIAIYPAGSDAAGAAALERVEIFPLAEMQAAIDAEVASRVDVAAPPPAGRVGELVALIETRPLLASAVALGLPLAFLLLGLMLAGRGRARDADGVALSEEQRQQLLMDLQVWLMADKDLARDEST